MRRLRKAFGRGFIETYRLTGRAWGKAFSVASLGCVLFVRATHRHPAPRPNRRRGTHFPRRLRVRRAGLLAPGPRRGRSRRGRAANRNRTSFAGDCVVSAALSITIGEGVLFARGIYISDHSHAFGDAETPILGQGIDKVEPVVIEDGAWLGENVVVCPGVRIGKGAVIGANSVGAAGRSRPLFSRRCAGHRGAGDRPHLPRTGSVDSSLGATAVRAPLAFSGAILRPTAACGHTLARPRPRNVGGATRPRGRSR